METGSPYFHLYSPGLALSRGGSLSYSSSPLSESALICSSFSPRRFILSLLVLARIGVRVTRPGRRRICGSLVFGQNALMPWSRALRAGPSGEERCTPHYTVPVSPQCPQEISLLTLPVFQGAAVSSERFSQSLPPRNVAELGSSPPLRGSLEQLDRPSPAGPPFQGTKLAALSTRV